MKVRDTVKGELRSVVTRAEALELGLTRYFTGKACVHGHVAERQISDKKCCECNRLSQRNENMTAEQRARRLVANMTAEQIKRQRASMLIANLTPEQRERKLARGRKATMSPEAYARWLESTKRNDLFRQGRIGQSRLLPWYDRDAVVSFYVLANQLTEQSGVEHHVDHIVALGCKQASGLHVQTNLRIVPCADNLSKHARLDDALAVNPNPPQCTLDTCACGKRAALFTGLLAA